MRRLVWLLPARTRWASGMWLWQCPLRAPTADTGTASHAGVGTTSAGSAVCAGKENRITACAVFESYVHSLCMCEEQTVTREWAGYCPFDGLE